MLARLRHPNACFFNTLLPCLPPLNNHIGFCESYKLRKSTKLPCQARISYSSTFLHTLHLNVWGPAPTTSYDGLCFYLVIVDEFS